MRGEGEETERRGRKRAREREREREREGESNTDTAARTSERAREAREGKGEGEAEAARKREREETAKGEGQGEGRDRKRDVHKERGRERERGRKRRLESRREREREGERERELRMATSSKKSDRMLRSNVWIAKQSSRRHNNHCETLSDETILPKRWCRQTYQLQSRQEQQAHAVARLRSLKQRRHQCHASQASARRQRFMGIVAVPDVCQHSGLRHVAMAMAVAASMMVAVAGMRHAHVLCRLAMNVTCASELQHGGSESEHGRVIAQVGVSSSKVKEQPDVKAPRIQPAEQQKKVSPRQQWQSRRWDGGALKPRPHERQVRLNATTPPTPQLCSHAHHRYKAPARVEGTRAHTHIHTNSRTRTHTNTHARARATHTHTRARTKTHTHRHTQPHTATHIPEDSFKLRFAAYTAHQPVIRDVRRHVCGDAHTRQQDRTVAHLQSSGMAEWRHSAAISISPATTATTSVSDTITARLVLVVDDWRKVISPLCVKDCVLRERPLQEPQSGGRVQFAFPIEARAMLTTRGSKRDCRISSLYHSGLKAFESLPLLLTLQSRASMRGPSRAMGWLARVAATKVRKAATITQARPTNVDVRLHGADGPPQHVQQAVLSSVQCVALLVQPLRKRL